MTFSGVQGVVSVALGDHLAADAIITLGYSDAQSLASGELDAAKALHEGRIKLRGDASALVAFMNSLRA